MPCPGPIAADITLAGVALMVGSRMKAATPRDTPSKPWVRLSITPKGRGREDRALDQQVRSNRSVANCAIV